MTTTTTVPDLSASRAYQDKLLALLGDRDPIQVMSTTPDFFAKAVRENDAATLRTRPFPGKWTPLEILGHLVDSEWVYGFRTRLILCELRPRILGMNQDDWVAGQRHNDRDPASLADAFRSLRNLNLDFVWNRLTTDDLNKSGLHNERGEESLGLMIRMEAGHDLSHIDQFTRYLAAVKSGVRA